MAVLLASASCAHLPRGGSPAGREAFWPDIDLAAYDSLPRPVLARMSPSRPADFWQMRRSYRGWGKDWDRSLERTQPLDSAGSPCGGAPDRARCLQALETVRAEEGFTPGCHPAYCVHYLVSTHGDEVRAWDTPAEVVAFLAPIDTPDEAVFVARLMDLGYGGRGGKAYGAIREDGEGYLLITTRTDRTCFPIVVSRRLVRVTRAGDVTSLRRKVVERRNDCVVI